MLRRWKNATVWAAVLGTDSFDITWLRTEGIALRRADGVGGSVAPRNLKFKDEGTPFEGDLCGCHTAGKDGVTDLRMQFKTSDIVAALALDDVPSGVEVEVVITGTLTNNWPFAARDCLLVVHPGD